MDSDLGMERKSILHRVGSVTNLITSKRNFKENNRKEEEEEEEDIEDNLDSLDNQEQQSSKMNMKQEGPFLVPQLWKESINLENITNDFLDSNVTGEVMNLDDFLKELQVNELVQQTEELQQRGGTPGGPLGGHLPSPQGGHHMGSHNQQQPEQDNRFQSLIRPTNIESLKEPSHPVRPSIMHHVGKPPELHMMHNPGHLGSGDHMGAGPNISLPHRGSDMGGMGSSLGAGHLTSSKEHQGGHSGIPQASVRPLVRPVIMSGSGNKHDHPDISRSEDTKPPAKKIRRTSEPDESDFDDDDDDDDDDDQSERRRKQNFGGFTSTVCVNFSQDDLRLATIPGQEGDFDPATRRFSEEELKPQPIIRKRKKQFVPDELKNNKYWAKRCKNNEAAKRSREARRLKENQIAMRAHFLEEENTALKGEVDILKKENSDLKQMMMALEEKLNHMTESR